MLKTPENFRKRIEKKIEIEFGNKKQNNVRVGSFWRYYEGINVGNEISKDKQFKRACIVLNNDLGNSLVLIVPLTTKFNKSQAKYYIKIDDIQKYGLKSSSIILNQIRLIDKKRLTGKMTEAMILQTFVKYILKKASLLILGIKK